MVAKSEYNKVFANNLRRIMHERDKNGADMARYLGVGKSRVSSWMNAQHIPRPDMVDKICAYLNCTRSDLMEENGVFSTYILPYFLPYITPKTLVSSIVTNSYSCPT